jgi:hypothetical protein
MHRAFDAAFDRASDGILDHPLLILAGLFTLYRILKSHNQGPTEYDLTKYQPKKLEW